jgi:endonuclease III
VCFDVVCFVCLQLVERELLTIPALLAVSESELESHISSVHYCARKAQYLKLCAQRLHRRSTSAAVSALASAPSAAAASASAAAPAVPLRRLVPRSMAGLEEFAGVGPKLAAIVVLMLREFDKEYEAALKAVSSSNSPAPAGALAAATTLPLPPH